jgi:hypothetical protein
MGYYLLDTEIATPQAITDITSIVSGEAFGEPILSFINYMIINAESITSVEVFGIPQLNQTILPESILSGESFGDITVGNGVRTIYAFRISSAESFGIPSLTMQIRHSSILSSESFGNPRVGHIADEPFEKSKQTLSNWKPIKQEVGNKSMIGETIWDLGLTSWDNGNTHWDAIEGSTDIMKKINPSSTFSTKGRQSNSNFNKSKQSATSFNKVKEL